MNISGQIPELELQKAVHQFLSNPSDIYKTNNGRRLQILSPGRLNVHAGPDFLEIAVLLNGMIIVGNAEFHRTSSDWIKHKHDTDKRYNSVILHIVFDYTSMENENFETLVLDRKIIGDLSQSIKSITKDIKSDIFSLEDLQDYALLRLLRKTSEAQAILNFSDLDSAISTITAKFLERYGDRRRRPIYNEDKLKNIIPKLSNSEISSFLSELYNKKNMNISSRLKKVLETKFADEGVNLRREIILNCILPIAFCLANTESRIGLFTWFWSTPALSRYGVLTRKFPNIPQKLLWQQQGMLEYLKEFGNRKNIISDVVKSYGFAEVLDFYHVGRIPIE